MSVVRGRACQCCAAAKRRCTGERPCKRCISLCATIEEATNMCIELPDRRTKVFVAQRKQNVVSGVKRSARPRSNLDSQAEARSLSQANNDTHTFGINTHSRAAFAGRTDEDACHSSAKRRAVAEHIAPSNMPVHWASHIGSRDIKKDDFAKSFQPFGASVSAAIQDKFRDAVKGFSAFSAHTPIIPDKSSAFKPALFGKTYNEESHVRALPMLYTPMTTSAATCALGTLPSESANHVVDSVIRDALAKSSVATLQITFDPRTKVVNSCFGNAAWTTMFGVSPADLAAMAHRGEIPRYVHAADGAKYVAASKQTLDAKRTDQVITARFVGAGGRIFVAQEASQLEYTPDGTVKRITLYYNETLSPIARSESGGITLPSTMPSMQAALPRASFIPLDASLSASIESAMRMIQEDNGKRKLPASNSATSFDAVDAPLVQKNDASSTLKAAPSFIADAEWPLNHSTPLQFEQFDKVGIPQLDPVPADTDDFFAPSEPAVFFQGPVGAAEEVFGVPVM